VANSCSRSWLAFAVPCHRVLHKDASRKEADSTAGSPTRPSCSRSAVSG
jgi:hypothetical protein